ncbi:YceD family protein [Vineibacter terrae]|nr:DUF177 domain-containing protein [Vineibacter terrae]
MHVDRNPDLELSRRLRLDRVPPAGATLDIEASATERDALAKRFGILALPSLSANVTLCAEGESQWRVEGRLKALVVQACGITLDPVEQAIDEAFVLRFTTQPEELDRDSGELIVGSEAAEPLSDDALDLGEIVADQLALAIDPFPRKPGVALADILPPPAPSGATGGPFAALAALKQGRKDQA